MLHLFITQKRSFLKWFLRNITQVCVSLNNVLSYCLKGLFSLNYTLNLGIMKETRKRQPRRHREERFRVHCTMSTDTLERLEKACEKYGVSRSYVIEAAVSSWLRMPGKKALKWEHSTLCIETIIINRIFQKACVMLNKTRTEVLWIFQI